MTFDLMDSLLGLLVATALAVGLTAVGVLLGVILGTAVRLLSGDDR